MPAAIHHDAGRGSGSRPLPGAQGRSISERAILTAKLCKKNSIGDWSRDQFGFGAALNYLSGFKDPAGPGIGAQTTVDLQAHFRFANDSRLGGTTLSINVRNVFDKDPPFYNDPTGFGFDAASGDVIGRFVSVQLAKSW